MKRLLALPLLFPLNTAAAKGPGLDAAVRRLDVPWTTARAGEQVEVRATLDLAGACERWTAQMFGGPVPEGAIEDCLDGLAWQLDGGATFSAYLVPKEGAAGPGTYLVESFAPWWGAGEEPVFRAIFELPDHWPAGAYSVSPSFGPLGDLADPELAGSPLVAGGLTVLGSGWEDAAQPAVVALQAKEQAGPDGHVGLRLWIEDDASRAVIARAALKRAGDFGEIPGLDHATVAFACHPCAAGGGVRTLCEADRPARVGGTWTAPEAGAWQVLWVEARDAAGRWNLGAANVQGVTVEVVAEPSEAWGPIVTLGGEPTEPPAGCEPGSTEPPLEGEPWGAAGEGAAGRTGGAGAAPEASPGSAGASGGGGGSRAGRSQAEPVEGPDRGAAGAEGPAEGAGSAGRGGAADSGGAAGSAAGGAAGGAAPGDDDGALAAPPPDDSGPAGCAATPGAPAGGVLLALAALLRRRR